MYVNVFFSGKYLSRDLFFAVHNVLFRFSSTGSVLCTLGFLFRLRTPIGMFLQRFRLFGLLVLLPLCLQVLLELTDERVSWRVYSFSDDSDSGMAGGALPPDPTETTPANLATDRTRRKAVARSINIRPLILYVAFPSLYLLLCSELGRRH